MPNRKLKNSILQLPLQEQVVLMEDLFASVKEKMFQEIEKADTSHLRMVYRFFQLNVEVSLFQKLLPQITSNAETESNSASDLKVKYGHLPIQWSTEEPDGDELFGIWKNNPRTLEQIREKAWKRNNTI